MYVLNAFSLNMLDIPEGETAEVTFRRITVEEAQRCVQRRLGNIGELISAVGHADTAAVFSDVLGVNIPANRIDVKLELYLYDGVEGLEYRDFVGCEPPPRRDFALLGQYKGPRLPEGTKTLPEGATIEWYMVFLEEPAPTVPDRY
jgi:hypothetical protein